jgi:hypothetical protein
LGVAIRKVRAQLQAVESGRTRAGKSRIFRAAPILPEHILLAHSRGKERIAPQVGMVVEVLVTQSQGKQTLPHQLGHTVLDAQRIARIGEALGNRAADTQTRIDLAQKKKPAIGTQRAAAEIGDNFS